MLEAGHVRVAEIEWQVSISIIDSAELFTLKVRSKIVLNNRSLMLGSDLGPGSLTVNAVTEGENVIVSLVLESVWANIDHSVGSGDTGVDELLVGKGCWVDVHVGEGVISDSASINMLESSDLLSNGILLNLHKLPSKVHIDSSLLAFFKSNLVGITELINPFIWSEISDSSRSAGNSLNLVLSEVRFIVKGPEVITLSLMWRLGRIAEHITVSMVPSMVVVLAWSILIVEDVNEAVVFFWKLLQLLETLNLIISMIETRSNDQCLV